MRIQAGVKAHRIQLAIVLDKRFDGDTSSFTMTYSDESKDEVKDFLAMRRAYVGTDGNFISSINVETVQLVFHNMTGKRKT
jgi:hypothetical protein